MTEKEWLACAYPTAMLWFLRNKVSERKRRLIACACCRRIWRWLPQTSREAVEVAEVIADGTVGEERQSKAYVRAAQAFHKARVGQWIATLAARMTVQVRVPVVHVIKFCGLRDGLSKTYKGYQKEREFQYQADVVRDILGNPFRTVVTSTGWLIPTVINLAQAIYDDRAFDRLPELADALEEVGFTCDSILNHLRSPGPHVKGCWPVDFLLGKK